MVKIYLRHMKIEPKYCVLGTKDFFKRQGWDWGDFLRNGIDVEKVKATGDEMAIKLAERAENG